MDEGALKKEEEEEEKGERAGKAELEDGEQRGVPLSALHILIINATLMPLRSAPLLSQSAPRLSRLPPRRLAKTRPTPRHDDDAPACPPAARVPLATRAALARRATKGTELPRDARPAPGSRGQVAREFVASGGDGRLRRRRRRRGTGDGLEGVGFRDYVCAAPHDANHALSLSFSLSMWLVARTEKGTVSR